MQSEALDFTIPRLVNLEAMEAIGRFPRISYVVHVLYIGAMMLASPIRRSSSSGADLSLAYLRSCNGSLEKSRTDVLCFPLLGRNFVRIVSEGQDSCLVDVRFKRQKLQRPEELKVAVFRPYHPTATSEAVNKDDINSHDSPAVCV